MNEIFERTAMLFGSDAVASLEKKSVIVFGVGGVGGYVCEALCRSGIGTIGIVDNDTVSKSNINRQIIATMSTVGKPKTSVMADRLHDINPDVKVICHNMFYLPENADLIDLSLYDYVVDAVDTVSAKIEIIERAMKSGIPVISSMGTGNKTDPSKLRIADISKTNTCPLAKVMRRELKIRGINHLKVVFSDEPPITPKFCASDTGKRAPASSAFVPPTAGLLIARQIVVDFVSAFQSPV